MNREEIKRVVKEMIEKEVMYLMSLDFLPDSIKQRHVGEGVRFIRTGLASKLPSSGEKTGAVYFERDTDKLKIWNGSSWMEIQMV